MSQKRPNGAEAAGKGAAGKLPTKRGPGRFYTFPIDNIRKREREKEKARAEKVTPEYHGKYSIWLEYNQRP